MKVMVTGGAGYVGSIVVEELLNVGHQVVVLDNLQQGHKDAVSPEAELIVADLCDLKAVQGVFQRYKVDAVMHMAAESAVQHSMTDPKRYFRSNVVGGVNLLDAMMNRDINKLIFSSSAAVYGDPKSVSIEEHHPAVPVNSYGESKLMFETILKWYGMAYGLRHISMRYFNAAGASQRFGEDHRPETHLIPNILRTAMNKSGQVTVYGADYDTKDGSCIRDYVHVVDIAYAHILALAKLRDMTDQVYNLGSGSGYSVLEVVDVARDVVGDKIPIKVAPRRPGDPAALVASSKRARAELGWRPKYHELVTIIDHAWRWMREHPNGYAQ